MAAGDASFRRHTGLIDCFPTEPVTNHVHRPESQRRHAGRISSFCIAAGLSGRRALVATPIRNDAFTVSPTTFARATAQYIAQADSICEATDAKVSSAQKTIEHADALGSPSSSEIVPALRKMDALGDASLPKLRAIPKPVGSVAILNDIWNALAQKFHVNAELIPAVETHSKAKLSHVSAALSTVTSKYESLAQRYGFNVLGGPAQVTAHD